MKPLKCQTCYFVQSSDGKNVPKDDLPHIILVGRSNVGKSSLINHLFNNKKLARISSKPGKTALLNFFKVDESVFFVDLPGYGFANKSKREVAIWGRMIDKYLEEHIDKIVFLQLIDSRHPPTEQDRQFMEWVESKGKNVLFILTKIDKINKSSRKHTIDKYAESLNGDVVPYSILDGRSRDRLLDQLNERMQID